MTLKEDSIMNSKPIFALIMEQMLDGQPHIEREITCYVKLRDLYDVTSLASSRETHEQWSLKTDSKKARMRIRLTDDSLFSMTIKENTNSQFESIETEFEINKTFFEALRRGLGKSGHLKTRYNIPIEDTDRKWEVDVFKTHAGTPSLWVKLDYEFNEGETEMPEIPFNYEEIIIPDIEEGRDKEVDRLWKEEWVGLNENDY